MTLSSRFQDALLLAAQLHADQMRKGTKIPYVAHLLIVAGSVLEHGGSEDEAIAALLHDAVEDQGGPPTYERIKAQFGQRVADIVQGCSDTDETPKTSVERTQGPTISSIFEVLPPPCDWSPLPTNFITPEPYLADYRDIGEEIWKRFNGGKEGTLWSYRALSDLFNSVGPARLAQELDRVVSELERCVEATSKK